MNELLLQASMGLSHIYHDIRVDSCRLVQLLLLHAPQAVVGSWPSNAGSGGNAHSTNGGNGATSQSNENRILDGLRLVAGIGGRAGEGGQNGLNLLPGSKLVILDTLLAFVRAGLGKQGFIKDDSDATTTTEKGKGKSARGSAAKDLLFPEEIFAAFESRYPTTSRISSTSVNGKGKGRQAPLLPITKLSDATFAETGALFDGWLVSQFYGEGMGMDMEGGAGWDLASVGRFVEAGVGGESGGDEVGQALAVRTVFFSLDSQSGRSNSLSWSCSYCKGIIPPHAPPPHRHPYGICTRCILPLLAIFQHHTSPARRQPLTLSDYYASRRRPWRPGLGSI